LVVWTDEEITREGVKGIFTIGVLASLFGVYQLPLIKDMLVAGSISDVLNALFFNGTTVFQGAFWGFYVVLTAMSMVYWNAGAH
jgi:hypothetical protein